MEAHVRSLFFEALQASIWDKPLQTKSFVGLRQCAWLQLIELCESQTVIALVADKLLTLPKEALPDYELIMRMMSRINQTETNNRLLTNAFAKLSKAYAEIDCPFVLLKGLSIIKNYPKPSLRATGDLDVFFPRKDDYKRANAWARQQGFRMEEEALYEQLFFAGRIPIENHSAITHFGQNKYDTLLQKVTDQMSNNKQYLKTEIAGTQTLVLPHTFNAFYLFHHILHHFSYLGISFRQVCDWVLFLHRHHRQIDKVEFATLANDFAVLRPMQIFARVAIKYLQAPPEIFPFDVPRSDAHVEMVVDEIFRGGNFGLDTFKGKRFSGKWSRRWFMFWQTTKRSFRVGVVSPEHIRTIPLIAIANRLRVLFN